MAAQSFGPAGSPLATPDLHAGVRLMQVSPMSELLLALGLMLEVYLSQSGISTTFSSTNQRGFSWKTKVFCPLMLMV